ncbi:MAG: VOC family protein [Aquabacterium sp.]
MRIRQIVFAATDLAAASQHIGRWLALDPPYADPGVGDFGLGNAVYAFGDQFIEVVSPIQDGTAAGRHIQRRGDSGYMVILQTDDLAREKARFAGLGVRSVWAKDLPDISAMHLHPKDIGCAIVSIDEPRPAASWRWGGPDWRVQPGMAGAQRVRGVTLEAADPKAMAQRWGQVLGLAPPTADGDGWRLALDGGFVRVQACGARGEGVAGYTLDVADRDAALERARTLGLPVTGDAVNILGVQVDLQAMAPA